MSVHKRFTLYFLSFVGALFLFIWTNSHPASAAGATRISGQNRFATAVKVAEKGWPNGANTVIVVRGREFADALTGTPLAYKLNAPILLTSADNLTPLTKQEIVKLKANKVIILGGTHAVSENVQNQIAHIPGVTVERIAGANRFETAQKVAEHLGNYDKAVVAEGYSFADSLAIAPYAAENGYPILLTTTNQLPEATKKALTGVSHTYVVGGKAAVSDKVAGQVPAPYRISGANRFETATAVVKKLFNGSDKAFVATGTNFADALSGSVLAAKKQAPILLVEKSRAPQSVQTLVDKHDFSQFTVLGGPAAVSEQAVNSILNTIGYNIVQDAKKYIGVPYQWGGTTPSGFDCSGFVGYVYRLNGIQLPRTSYSMWSISDAVNTPEPGDLVFFNTSGSGVSHVGIYIGDGKFISATSSRGVAIEDIHSPYYWGPRYMGARSVF